MLGQKLAGRRKDEEEEEEEVPLRHRYREEEDEVPLRHRYREKEARRFLLDTGTGSSRRRRFLLDTGTGSGQSCRNPVMLESRILARCTMSSAFQHLVFCSLDDCIKV